MAIIAADGFKISKTNTPTREGERIATIADITNREKVPNPFVGMLIFVEDEQAHYTVLELGSDKIGGIEVPNVVVSKYKKVEVSSEVQKELKTLNEDIAQAKIAADKAAADIGADSITLLQGGINSDGNANVSSYYLRTARFSTFKLVVNDGHTIGQLAQYDLGGNFVALYSDYTQSLEGVEWTPTSVVATDKEYMWVAIVFKGNSPTVAIYPREAVVKTFVSGLHYYMQGGESDPQSAAQQAKTIVNRTIEQLPNEEDLTLSDGKMQLANRAATVKDGKVANLGYVILRKDKSFAEQVVDANTIYEVRYEFDLNGEEVEIPANCIIRYKGGSIVNGKLIANNLRSDYYDVNPRNGSLKSINSIFKLLENCIAYSSSDSLKHYGIVNIYLDYGDYTVDDTIRLTGTGNSFRLIGKGIKNTNITVNIEDENALVFDNTVNYAFGSTEFKDLTFRGNGKYRFMEVEGVVTSQYVVNSTFIFNDCLFDNFKNFATATGDVLASEWHFLRTIFVNFQQDTAVFVIDNYESTNYHFTQCSFTSIYGHCFQIKRGTYISFCQGSVILDGEYSDFMYTDSEAVTSGCGYNLAVTETRFEIKRGAKLLNINHNNTFIATIQNCRMGVTMQDYSFCIVGANTQLYIYNIDNVANNTIKLNDAASEMTSFNGFIDTNNQNILNGCKNSNFPSLAKNKAFQVRYLGCAYQLPELTPLEWNALKDSWVVNNLEINVDYLAFTPLEEDCTFVYTNSASYSFDCLSWEHSDSPRVVCRKGQTVFWRSNNTPVVSEEFGIGNFTSVDGKKFSVSGNPLTLCYSNNIDSKKVTNSNFANLFNNCVGLVNAEKMILPNSVAPNSHLYMFRGCVDLVTAPKMPETSKLSYNCYKGMFMGCEALVIAPTLTSKELYLGCYEELFKNCVNLKYINLHALANVTNSMNNWVNGVGENGDIYTTLEDFTTGINGIPTTWTKHIIEIDL